MLLPFILCCSFLLLSSFFPSIRVFFTELALCIRWSNYWSFRISPSSEYSGLISFRIDCFDLLAVSRVFSSTAIWRHHFFGAQPSLWCYSDIHIWLLEKTYLWLMDLCSKVVSLLFNMLSRFVIAFLPRSKCLLISRLQSPSAVILEPKKIKSVIVSTFSPSICHEMIGQDATILVFSILSFKPAFLLSSFTLIKRLSSSSYHTNGIICLSEIVSISPGSLDSSLCFIQPSISPDVLCIEVK